MVYNKTSWKSGDVITADKLNNIENGISEHDHAYIIETYKNGSSGYRIYSDGYCEQYGIQTVTATGETTIQLLKSYPNADTYLIFGSISPGNAANWYQEDQGSTFNTRNNNSFTKHLGAISGTSTDYCWFTCGYIN